MAISAEHATAETVPWMLVQGSSTHVPCADMQPHPKSCTAQVAMFLAAYLGVGFICAA